MVTVYLFLDLRSQRLLRGEYDTVTTGTYFALSVSDVNVEVTGDQEPATETHLFYVEKQVIMLEKL